MKTERCKIDNCNIGTTLLKTCVWYLHNSVYMYVLSESVFLGLPFAIYNSMYKHSGM